MQKRFVSWIAVSSLPQAKKISLEDQLETNKEHIARWDGVLVAALEVPGKSRSIVTWEEACGRIEAYAQLKELLAQRAFDVLIYRDNSRLGRTTSLVVTIAELCHRAGVVMYPTESPPQDLSKPTRNLASRMTDVFQSVIAQDEVDKFTRRNEMGMKARVMRGDFPGAIPYGWKARYELKEGKPVTVIEIDDIAASAVRIIVDLYLHKGLGMRPISNYLRAHGYTAPRGGRWFLNTVSQLLNIIMRYAGYVELNSKEDSKRPYVRAKSKWPAIISEEDALAVIKERKYRASRKRAVESVHRFSGVVWCGRCNKRMAATTATKASKRNPDVLFRREKFRCSDIDTISRHDKSEISSRYLMDAVRGAFLALRDKAVQARILGQSEQKASDIQAGIRRVQEQLDKQKQALQRADDAYIDGKMDLERYNQQVDRLKEQWVSLQAALAEYESALQEEMFSNRRQERLQEIVTDGIAYLETDDKAAANAWLRRHIKIWVRNDIPEKRIRIEFL